MRPKPDQPDCLLRPCMLLHLNYYTQYNTCFSWVNIHLVYLSTDLGTRKHYLFPLSLFFSCTVSLICVHDGKSILSLIEQNLLLKSSKLVETFFCFVLNHGNQQLVGWLNYFGQSVSTLKFEISLMVCVDT